MDIGVQNNLHFRRYPCRLTVTRGMSLVDQ